MTEVNWWFALPLTGAITGIAPVRGTELYYRITSTAIRKRVWVRLIPFISPSHSTVSSQVFAFLRKASCESFFLSTVEPGGYFLALRHQ